MDSTAVYIYIYSRHSRLHNVRYIYSISNILIISNVLVKLGSDLLLFKLWRAFWRDTWKILTVYCSLILPVFLISSEHYAAFHILDLVRVCLFGYLLYMISTQPLHMWKCKKWIELWGAICHQHINSLSHKEPTTLYSYNLV